MAELTIAGLNRRYVVERELGRGGMGAVYLARDQSLDRLVAIKVLPAELAAQGDLRERFLRETRTAASFSHPNIVPVHGVEESETLLAFTMGYVEGESLAARVRRTGPLSVRDAVKLLQDVGWALAYAHGRGVVHRDIKPDNILMDRATGRALVTDFGIARAMVAPEARQGLTRVGEVVGTPEFMSPEQATGDVVDGRSDLYSLGLVAFFALTGELAGSGDTTQKVLARQLTENAPPLLTMRPDLPPTLASAIDRLLCKDPDERFPSAEALVEALEESQLAGPEVAVPVRVLERDIATTGLVALFLLIVTDLLIRRALDNGLADLDVALPGIFVLALIWGRVASTFGNARRVVEAGFPPETILTGFRALAEERAGERARLRLLPRERARRTRAVRWSLARIAAAIGILVLARQLRVQIGPESFRPSAYALLMSIAAMIMFGLALATLGRTPFRASVPERLFTRLVTGPMGRVALRLVAWRATVPSSQATRAGGAAVVSGMPRVAQHSPVASAADVRTANDQGAEARFSAIEDRVASIERQLRSRDR